MEAGHQFQVELVVIVVAGEEVGKLDGATEQDRGDGDGQRGVATMGSTDVDAIEPDSAALAEVGAVAGGGRPHLESTSVSASARRRYCGSEL